jgi:SH3-like domain-containing protein
MSICEIVLRAGRPAGRRLVGVLAAALVGLPALGFAAGGSGLKVPRFVSLRASEVNVRAGPGVRYPINWVFLQRAMPVEVIAEFDAWRKIRDWQGTEGWVHQSMLSGKRTMIVTGTMQPLRREPAPAAPVIAQIEEKAIGKLLRCNGTWCRVEVAGVRGWLMRSQFWGSYDGEPVD